VVVEASPSGAVVVNKKDWEEAEVKVAVGTAEVVVATSAEEATLASRARCLEAATDLDVADETAVVLRKLAKPAQIEPEAGAWHSALAGEMLRQAWEEIALPLR